MTAPTDALIARCGDCGAIEGGIHEQSCPEYVVSTDDLIALANNATGAIGETHLCKQLADALAAALERERKLREDNDILRATCTAREEYAADIAALRADAERYRMIRPKGSQWSAVVCFLPHEDQLKRHTFYEGDALDAAIDAAIAKGGAA